MTLEYKDVIREFKGWDSREISLPVNYRILNNQIEATAAGGFLDSSGIMNAVIDFNEAFLGDMTAPRNEIKTSEIIYNDRLSKAASASIVLEWIDPNDYRHLAFTVSAGRSDSGEKYLCAKFNETRHYKSKKT